MLLKIRGVLDSQTLLRLRRDLDSADWQDGRGSAGYLSRLAKNNAQLADRDPLGRALGERILLALEGNPVFTAAALPRKIVPPLFNRYANEQNYGAHIDGAIRPVAGTNLRVRTDLSATIFLTSPEEYEGGELVIGDSDDAQSVKLDAGDMVLYPGTYIHHVEPVTRGVRLASFFWIESMVRSERRRSILFDLDKAIQSIATETPCQKALVNLAGVYHNLLRIWADS